MMLESTMTSAPIMRNARGVRLRARIRVRVGFKARVRVRVR
jgi:hypothetical protein